MRILCVGDLIASDGVRFFCDNLPKIKNEYAADLVIVNGENSAPSGVGINMAAAKSILAAGADAVTTGNHAFRCRDYTETFETVQGLIRPYNFGSRVSGRGVFVCEARHRSVAVINLVGLSYMDTNDSYFDALDDCLASVSADIYIVDFHAEATAEKAALAYYADGRVSAVFGTHTHVQTADARVLPRGTGFITDIGMTGAEQSVLGVRPEDSITKQRLRIPVIFTPAEGNIVLCGAVFDINDKTALCERVESVRFTAPQ